MNRPLELDYTSGEMLLGGSMIIIMMLIGLGVGRGGAYKVARWVLK